MRLRGKGVGDLTAEDLSALVTAKAPESVELEYKVELPGTADSDKKEYLADVSAFANTAGGVLLYGIETERDDDGKDTGIAKDISGVVIPNENELRLRLTSIVRDGLDPRLVPDIAMQVIDVEGAKQVLAIGVSRSVAGPHAVWFQKTGKFHRRSSAGKYQADTREIRRMFLERESWEEDVRAFRDRTLGQRVSNAGERELVSLARVILHIVPLGRRDDVVDVRPHEATIRTWADEAFELEPRIRRAFNYDGYLIAGHDPHDRITAFAQLYRNGAIEASTRRFHNNMSRPGGELRSFELIPFTNWLPLAIQRSLELLSRDLGVDPPFGVYVSALQMLRRETEPIHSHGVFDRDTVQLPLIFISDLAVDWQATCDPALLVLWQSAGLRDIVR